MVSFAEASDGRNVASLLKPLKSTLFGLCSPVDFSCCYCFKSNRLLVKIMLGIEHEIASRLFGAFMTKRIEHMGLEDILYPKSAFQSPS
jgi:hypothetical protein